MVVYDKTVLFLAVLVAFAPVTDPSEPSSGLRSVYSRVERSTSKQSCVEKIAACGEYPRGDEAVNMKCRLRKKKNRCQVFCTYTCWGNMKRSTYRRQGPYECVNGEWKSTAAKGYCIADNENFIVKEVNQNSTLHEKMNELIKKLLMSTYEFVAMSSFYQRANVSLPGFKKLMAGLAAKDLKFAQDVISYEIERGESLHLYDIERPNSYEALIVTLRLNKRSGKVGLEKALAETKEVTAFLTEIIQEADPHRKHFLEDNILDVKVNTIKKLADMQYTLESFTLDEDYDIGEYRMDLELREQLTE